MKMVLLPLFFLSLLFAQACKESLKEISSQSEINIGEIKSINGVLSFKDFDAFSHFGQQNSKVSDVERKALENQYQYTSLLSNNERHLSTSDNEIAPLYYGGAMGISLNRDKLVIIGNQLYLFDYEQIKSITLKNSTFDEARKLLTDKVGTSNQAVHTSVINDELPSSKGARVGNDYIVQSSTYLSSDHNFRYYSTASLHGRWTILSDGTRVVIVSIRLKPYLVPNNSNPSINPCTSIVQQASGSFNMYEPSKYGVPYELYGPYTFTVDVNYSGGGAVEIVEATFAVPNTTEGRSETYFEGTGSFTTSHGTCFQLSPPVTSATLNL